MRVALARVRASFRGNDSGLAGLSLSYRGFSLLPLRDEGAAWQERAGFGRFLEREEELVSPSR